MLLSGRSMAAALSLVGHECLKLFPDTATAAAVDNQQSRDKIEKVGNRSSSCCIVVIGLPFLPRNLTQTMQYKI